MRRPFLMAISGFAALTLLSTSALAGGHSPADFPLRVHVFGFSAHSHYTWQNLDEVDGEGRANLYENGEPRGFDFGYRCGDRLRVSPGYETYMAKWKKPGRELEILLPVFGKPGAMESCDLKVDMKDAAYHRHNGLLAEEPIARYKEWMDLHQYDPEHGKNEPVPAPAAAGKPAAQ